MTHTEQTTAAAAGASSATAALISSMQEWALGLFGVPLPAVFGAFAGTCFGVTMGHTMKWYALAPSVVATTMLAAIGAPLVLSWLLPSAPPPAVAGAAALTGFLLQFGAPWLKQNREHLLNKWFGIAK